MLDLGLKASDCLYQLSLLLKTCISNELGVVHLHHLKLFSSRKFLLNQCLFFTIMRLLYLIYLRHETLLIFCSLLFSHFFNLVVQFDNFLCVIRLQLFLIAFHVFYLLPQLFKFKLHLAF